MTSLQLTECFFFNDTATTEIYTLSLHDALPICDPPGHQPDLLLVIGEHDVVDARLVLHRPGLASSGSRDRKSTRLNSSHANISYAVFCLKKKNNSLYSMVLLRLLFPRCHHSTLY